MPRASRSLLSTQHAHLLLCSAVRVAEAHGPRGGRAGNSQRAQRGVTERRGRTVRHTCSWRDIASSSCRASSLHLSSVQESATPVTERD